MAPKNHECGCGALTANAKHGGKGKPTNPLRLDPTRTTALRRQLMGEMRKRFRKLRGEVNKLVIEDDAFGLAADKAAGQRGNAGGSLASVLVGNTRWRFESDADKVASYRTWLKSRVRAGILEVSPGQAETPWMEPYIKSAYKRGVVRAHLDTHAARIAASSDLSFVQGGKEAFLESAFNSPIAQSKVKQLSTRAFSQLEGVTAQMDQEMTRVLSDGLSAGHGSRKIARELNQTVSGLEKRRALTIARTEIVHTHNEGQLDSFEAMGIEGVNVMAEWNTAHDDKVCPLCEPMEGVVLKISEARGMIPRHPNCRCAWLPADVGEIENEGTTTTTWAGKGQGLSPPGTKPTGKTTGQLWSKAGRNERIRDSIKAESPGMGAKAAREASRWVGADLTSVAGKLKPGSAAAQAAQAADKATKAAALAKRTRAALAARTAKQAAKQAAWEAEQAAAAAAQITAAKAKYGITNDMLVGAKSPKPTILGGVVGMAKQSSWAKARHGVSFEKADFDDWVQALGKIGRPTKPVLVHQLDALEELMVAKAAKDPAVAAKVFAKKQKDAVALEAFEAPLPTPKAATVYTKDGEWVDEKAVFGRAPADMPWDVPVDATDALDKGKGAKQLVDIGDLHPTQEYTGYKKAAAIAKDFDPDKAVVTAIDYGGKLYIHDGHHTATAARIAGERKVWVKIEEAADWGDIEVPAISYKPKATLPTPAPLPAPAATTGTGASKLAHSLKVKLGMAKKKHGLTDAELYGSQLNKDAIGKVAEGKGVYLTAAERKAVRYTVPEGVETPQLVAQMAAIEDIKKAHAKDKMTPKQKAFHDTEAEDGVLAMGEASNGVNQATIALLDEADYSELAGWGAPPAGKTQSYGVLLFDDEGRMLMREPKDHFGGASWTFAKGGGTKPGTTALAELAEETGHKGIIHDALPGAHVGGTTKTNYFLGKSGGHDPSLMDAETANLKWMSYDEAKEAIKSSSSSAVVARDLKVLDEAYAHLKTVGSNAAYNKLHAAAAAKLAEAAEVAAKAAHGHKVKLGMAKKHYAKDKFGGGVEATDWAVPDKLNSTGLNKVLSEKGWHLDTLPGDEAKKFFGAADVVAQKALVDKLKKAPKGTAQIQLPTKPVVLHPGHVTAAELGELGDVKSFEAALLKGQSGYTESHILADFDEWAENAGVFDESPSPSDLAKAMNEYKAETTHIYGLPPEAPTTVMKAPAGFDSPPKATAAIPGGRIMAAQFESPGGVVYTKVMAAAKQGHTPGNNTGVAFLNYLDDNAVVISELSPAQAAKLANDFKLAHPGHYPATVAPKATRARGHVTAADFENPFLNEDHLLSKALKKGSGSNWNKHDIVDDFDEWVASNNIPTGSLTADDLADEVNKYKAAKPQFYAPKAERANVVQDYFDTLPKTPAPKPEATAALPAMGDLTKVKDLPGSTKPWLGKDKAGKQWVVKDVAGSGIAPAHLESEALADELYRLLGIPTNRGGVVKAPGGLSKVTEFFEGGQTLADWQVGKTKAQVAALYGEIRGGFVADALLANHDVAGLSMDNIFVVGGKAHRIDNGGALTFRAQGAKKATWGAEVQELAGLRDANLNPNTATIFKGITDEEIHEQIRHIVAKRAELLQAVPDAAVRKVLNARIDDLAKRLPKTARTSAPTGTRRAAYGNSAETAARAKQGRSNGVNIAGDKRDIEDNNLLAWEEVDAGGKTVTKLQFKVTKPGSDKIIASLGDDMNKARATSSPTVVVSNKHPDDNYWGAVQAGAKTIGAHAKDGAYNAGTITALENSHTTIKKALNQAKVAVGSSSADMPKLLAAKAKLEMLEHYDTTIENLLAHKAKQTAPPMGSAKNYIYKPPKVAAAEPEATRRRRDYRVQRDSGINFRTNTFKDGGGRGNGGANTFSSEAYTVEVSEDINFQFLPNDGEFREAPGRSLHGTVSITVNEEMSEASIERALGLVEDLGIDTTPPAAAYEEALYLHRGVYMNKKHTSSAYKDLWESDIPAEEKVVKLKKWIKTNMKIDVDKVAHYDPAGVTKHADGSGFRHWVRWDIDPKKLKAEMGNYSLQHTTGSSLHDSPRGSVATTLGAIIDSGGEFTSTSGRIRKGVSVRATGGGSSTADVPTGGASYFFTRIIEGDVANGFFFKPSALMRQDLISYDSDNFGRISNIGQRATGIEGFKSNSLRGGNESIFKEGFSMADLEYIKVRPDEVAGVLRAFSERGVTHLPDGRAVKDIVHTNKPPASKRVF
jgi:SPP1 gp7 family putative phage head morphogenesis protein